MSKQWGHGFHKGKIEGIQDALLDNTEDGLIGWISNLRKGGRIAKADWSPECWGMQYIFVKKGQLFMNSWGIVCPYELTKADLECDNWFGIIDTLDEL